MPDRKVLGVLVSGRGSNLQAILDAINAGEIRGRVGVVISDNPAAYALERAAGLGIPALCIERKSYTSREKFELAVVAELKQYQVKLVVLAGFMRILSPAFLSHFPGRVMNIHPSLLPAFPGLDPQSQAIRYGVKLSGCTVHFVDDGMDSGPVILQEAVPVLPDDTPADLAERILRVEHRLYPRAVSLYCQGRLKIDGRKVEIDNGTEEDGR